MKILILGKNGQVGQSLVEIFHKKSLPYLALGHEEIDITDIATIEKRINSFMPTVFINTTAFHVVQECENDPQKAFLINTTAVKNIAEVCGKKNILFVTYSSDYVFDGKKGKPYNENDVVSPLQIYGISKVAGELATFAYNPNAIVIRTSGVYGGKQGSKAKKGNFVINLLRDAKDKQTIEVSSEQIVSTTYAVDLAKATIDLLRIKPEGGIYHMTNEGHSSWADFAKKIILYARLPTSITPVDRGGYSSNAHRPVFSALSNNKALALGVQLPRWEKSLKTYIEYLQK